MFNANDWKAIGLGVVGIGIGATLITTANYKTQVAGNAPNSNQQVIYQVELPNKGPLSLLGLLLIAGSSGAMAATGVAAITGKKEVNVNILPPTSLPIVDTSPVISPVMNQNVTQPITNNYGFNPFQEIEKEPTPPPAPTGQAIDLPLSLGNAPASNYSYSVDDVWDGDSYIAQNDIPQLPKSTTNPPVVQTGYQHTAIKQTQEQYSVIPLTSQLINNDLSWVLAGLPGAGKSTLLLAWLAGIVEKSKGVQVFINGWKADDWLGLANVSGVYQRNFYEGGTANFEGFFDQLNAVSEILHERLALPKKERRNLNKVWLILDDFAGTSSALNSADKELAKRWEAAKSQMALIITVGREVGVALCAATQSLNIKALGCEDANIRGCLGICALAKLYTTENGRKEGGYSTITNIWKNTYIIPSEYTQKIVDDFNKVRPISEKTGFAIALTTCGEPDVGIFNEDLSWVEDYQIPISLPKEKEPDAMEFLKEFAKKNDFSEIPDDHL